MVCPECRSEFTAGTERCPDCGVALVETLPPANPDQPAWIEVIETADPSLLPVLESALDAAGIPCTVAGEEAVGIFPLGLNDTHFAQSGIAARLLVPREREAEAREILATTANAEGLDGEGPDD